MRVSSGEMLPAGMRLPVSFAVYAHRHMSLFFVVSLSYWKYVDGGRSASRWRLCPVRDRLRQYSEMSSGSRFYSVTMICHRRDFLWL